MRYTELEGRNDYENGLPYKNLGQAHARGFYDKYTDEEFKEALKMKKKEETINPPDINKWLAGEILARAGGKLPDDAPDSAKSGYYFRREMDRMRNNELKRTK